MAAHLQHYRLLPGCVVHLVAIHTPLRRVCVLLVLAAAAKVDELLALFVLLGIAARKINEIIVRSSMECRFKRCWGVPQVPLQLRASPTHSRSLLSGQNLNFGPDMIALAALQGWAGRRLLKTILVQPAAARREQVRCVQAQVSSMHIRK